VPGIPTKLLPHLNVTQLRKRLHRLVKELAELVDADWHDSYEETGDLLCAYVESLTPNLSAVLECLAACRTPATLARCNDVLLEVAHSWRAMDGIPFRGGYEDPITDAGIDLAEPMGLLLGVPEDEAEAELDEYDGLPRHSAVSLAWTSLAAAAASCPAVDDALLRRILRDALDHGVERREFEEEPFEEEEGAWHTIAGAARLKAALGPRRQKALEAMPTRLRPIRYYQAIDRRFDGPLHLRTRDFSESDAYYARMEAMGWPPDEEDPFDKGMSSEFMEQSSDEEEEQS